MTPTFHYGNTPIQIYWKFYNLKKRKKIQINNSDIFYIPAQNIDGSNEYHNLCFWAEIRKIMYTPVNPSFTI